MIWGWVNSFSIRDSLVVLQLSTQYWMLLIACYSFSWLMSLFQYHYEHSLYCYSLCSGSFVARALTTFLSCHSFFVPKETLESLVPLWSSHPFGQNLWLRVLKWWTLMMAPFEPLVNSMSKIWQQLQAGWILSFRTVAQSRTFPKPMHTGHPFLEETDQLQFWKFDLTLA